MNSMPKPLFCIIDASSFIFRAYYAVRPLSNKAGLPTNAVFGFASMIVKVLDEFHPSHIAVVYDTKFPSFRKEMYPEYKANRSAMPEDLVPQIPYIKKFVETLGLPAFERNGFEADDVIATLAEQSAHLSKEADVCIISSDKDLMQLVNKSIYLYDTMKEQKFTEAEVKTKLGVLPHLVPDYLGIVGDSSDNIPGVTGIGPKGAVALLEQFGSVEGIYENLESVKKEGQRKQLADSKDNAILSKKLATVRRDLDIDTDWHSLRCEPHPSEDFFTLLAELEFHGFEKRMRSWRNGSTAAAPSLEVAAPAILQAVPSGDEVGALHPKFELITELSALEKALASLQEFVSLDTETTSLNPRDNAIVGFSFCGDEKSAYYVPLRHVEPSLGMPLTNQIPEGQALKALAQALKDKKIIGQNIKFDIDVFKAAGIEFKPEQIVFDTMIASYDLAPEDRHNLDHLANKYLGHQNIKYEDVCGTGKAEIPFSRVPLDKACEYAAEDAYVTFLLWKKLNTGLHNSPSLLEVFNKIDMPLVPVLAEMEWDGVAVDSEYLGKLSKEFSLELANLEKKAFELAGQEFNLASPKQLQKVLFEDLKLPAFKKTKTGFSTDVDVLEKLRSHHELPGVILDHRELSKLKNTYVDVLPLLLHKDTGRVHARFNQTVAATGRLSSSDPNLQNIPIRTELGKKVRQAFVARSPNVLLGADYSQIELRILASMSGDEALCGAFRDKQDVHSLTAAQIFGVPLAEVSEDQRRQAKAINFGILYGKSAFSLADELGITRTDAAEIIKKYFARYPTIRGFIDGLMDAAKTTGYAETLFGRRRKIEGIDAKNKMILAMAERMAVNTPIQGTAADLIKLAMIELYRELAHGKLRAKMILQVHDELVFEVHKDDAAALKALVIEKMENAGHGKFSVPLTVGIGIGANWLEL